LRTDKPIKPERFKLILVIFLSCKRLMNKRIKYFKSTRLLLPGLISISIIIILISVWYYQVEKKAFLNQKIDQLNSIADIKIDQMVDWRNERFSDARYLSVSRQINESFHILMGDPENLKYQSLLHNSLNGMFLNGKYESMVAFDNNGRLFFSLPSEIPVRTWMYQNAVMDVSKSSFAIKMGDLNLNMDNTATMQILVPQPIVAGKDTSASGWIILNLNLSTTFLPLLETIPVPSESMEVLLVHQENNIVLHFNRKSYPGNGTSGIQNNSNKKAEFREFKGFNGAMTGVDYRGKQVIAVSYQIPGSKIFLMVKMDVSEAFSDVRKLKFNVISMAGLMILAFTSSLSFFWMKQRNELLSLETEKKMILERFDMLSKFANDAIIVYTKDLTILQVNDKALELYGYLREEFLGMSAELLRSPETRSGLPQMLEITIREGGYRYETIHIRNDGTKFPVEVSLRYMELMGSPCFQALVRDITQRKQFEKALIASEERLRLITNTMPQIVWTAKGDGSFEFVNSRFEYLTGQNPLKENATIDFLHEDDKERVISYWLDAIHDIREHQIRLRIRMKDGSFRWFLCLAIPMCGEDGSVIRWYGSATDIDELENMVAQRTEELSDLYNNAPCGYHSLDINGIFLKINNTALKWLGYEREELIGKLSFSDILTEESKRAFKKNFKLFIKQGFVDNLEYDMLRKDGTLLPVLLSATSVRDIAGNIIMTRSTTVDHTVRRHHENEILKLNSILQEHGYNLENANKELEAFTFSVSHDLRAPLRAINGFSQILLDDYSGKLDSEGKLMLEKVLSNAYRMRHLIEDLLRLSRTGRQELNYTRIDMQALFNSMIEEIRQLFTERTIKTTVAQLPKAYGDLALLKQVISNLLSNGVKFSSKQATSELEIGSMPGDDEIIFFIKDNGTGFDMKYAFELFGVFHRLNNADEFEGTGVGLALVKRIIDKHGGRVWADSEPGKGATFFFSLPRNKNS
jgi:PAS domain S-box-containing protein